MSFFDCAIANAILLSLKGVIRAKMYHTIRNKESWLKDFIVKTALLRDDRLLRAKPSQQQSNKVQGRGIWIPSLRENLQNFCGNL